jgi:hypothetical protein
MPLREADAARLAAAGHDPARFARVEDGWLLLRNENGSCVFLTAQGQCGVHDLRPEGCRLYPLVWEEDDAGNGAAAMDEVCPWREEFATNPQDRRRLDALVRVLVRERAARSQEAGFK